MYLFYNMLIIINNINYVIENRILDAMSVFLSVPLPKKTKELDDNSHVSTFK